MNRKVKIEVCIDSVRSAIAAQEGGACRVELCDNLFAGGTTPSAGTIEVVRNNIDIGLHVIIRPRGGDFCYSDLELEIMEKDIGVAKELGADGVVIGVLCEDGTVDTVRTRELVEAAGGMKVTFHRAFDMTRNPFEALEDIISIGGISRVLTSGQEQTAHEGLDTIKKLVGQADGRIIIMPGGGVNERNIHKIVNESGVTEIHSSGRRAEASCMTYRKSGVYMGGTLRVSEFENSFVDATRIQAMREVL